MLSVLALFMVWSSTTSCRERGGAAIILICVKALKGTGCSLKAPVLEWWFVGADAWRKKSIWKNQIGACLGQDSLGEEGALKAQSESPFSGSESGNGGEEWKWFFLKSDIGHKSEFTVTWSWEPEEAGSASAAWLICLCLYLLWWLKVSISSRDYSMKKGCMRPLWKVYFNNE